MKIRASLCSVILTFDYMLSPFAYAKGALSENIRITSDVLGYDLKYRVYLPEHINTAKLSLNIKQRYERSLS